MTQTQNGIDRIKSVLTNEFKIKGMGQLHYCLGISIVQDEENSTMCLHQNQYIQSLLKKFTMKGSKVASTPANINVKFCKDDGLSLPVDKVLYQSLVDSLLYAAIATRADISYSIEVVAQYSSNPSQSHISAARCILLCLKGPAHYGL